MTHTHRFQGGQTCTGCGYTLPDPQTNEAAERLHLCTEDCLADCPWCSCEVDHTAAFHLPNCALGRALDYSLTHLAAERRATVERIRERLPQERGLRWLDAILDEEAAR